ncbi:heat shock 70 kDa protein 12B-like [Mizuhopecten yessoensis]|uniref:Heat shock 70 kDa protein n=1 Tax=Mizuhopecten yessoensis TaxID=6573 RepID=A0A1C9U302_MIZYE|nr:heat shock 70 kDa protein 12B-like [Mizuhopecten yessoensis]XP_021373551.1 heat shock 70 kDa protein 12B-like [Mizuhopecten yessoensis]AOR17370.1 heat shock 70 kDa protein [Mizuhopecten yessoensis]OWF40770.1 Heat shock 70 kDa protein 12B [Mizuhopecten yessoensis]
MASIEKHLLVAAIDFGTTYSGYAFSFLHDYQRDPLKISANNWTAGSGGLISLKTSTCVLFKPNGDFHSFGFEAEDKYSDLSLDREQEGWYYFRRFKMKLYENKCLNRSFKIEDDQGHTMAAIKVFTAVIKYLKDQMLTSCKNQMTDIKATDILWVLTVPAIWSDASKQFMREAAEAAGIQGNHLLIALEPEAASMYCKYLPLERKGEGGLKTFTAGSKYLVLDAGGGTIDITVHEVQRDGSLKEIHKANGGDWGGTKVDHAFQVLLSGIIGNGAFHSFMEKNKADMVEFFRDFEVKKRTIKPNASSDEKVTFKVPSTMNDACKDENSNDIATIVKSKQHFKGNLSVVGDKLRVSGDRAKELFKDPVKHIVAHLKKLLDEPSARGVKSILMVGGFSESLVLQDAIKKGFPNLRMIVPQDAGLAVLKGAVIFGHEPRAITSRVCKYTYGVNCTKIFDAEKHDPSHRYTTSDGQVRCRNIFDIHVRIGDCVDIGQPQTVKSYRPTNPDQTAMSFEVYVSTETDPDYVTDPGCTKIGIFKIAMPDTSKGLKRSVSVQMTFSNAELEVEAADKDTGEKVTAAFDFL